MHFLKIGTIVVCIGAAAYFFFNYVGEDETTKIDDTLESATTWMCRGCKHFFKLTAKQFHDEEADAIAAGGKPAGFGPLLCPKCRKAEVYRANQCPKHGIYYFVADAPDSRGMCEECYRERQEFPVRDELPDETKSPEAVRVPLS